MKYFAILYLIVIIVGCNNNTVNTKKSTEKPEFSQKQLEKEFGKYIEEKKPKDIKYDEAYKKVLALWEVPFVEIFVSTRIGKAHVIVSGAKTDEPLVLLHGMNSSSTMWYPNINALINNHRVYAIDHLLDPGKSTQNKEIEDLSEVIDWYVEIFEKLELDEINLIGASQGGWLSVNITLNQKSRIKKIVLLSPAQTFIWIPPGTKVLSNIFFMINPERDQLRNNLETLSANVDNIEQAFVDQYFLATQKADFNKLTFDMRPFSDDELRTIQAPVLLLIGDQDIFNNEKSIEKAKKLLPNIQTLIVKDAGHFLSIDQSDTINKTIIEFLN